MTVEKTGVGAAECGLDGVYAVLLLQLVLDREVHGRRSLARFHSAPFQRLTRRHPPDERAA